MTTAGKPLRWGVLGTALIADKVGKAIQQTPGCQLTAIASRSKDRAERWAADRGVAKSYSDYQALLNDPDVDVVYIPLPPSMHAEWTIEAARRRKHVLCEKPLALDPAEAERMIQACREAGVLLMDGVMWVHHRRTAKIHETIQGGAIGDLRRVTAAFSFRWDEIPQNNIRLSEDLGGGCLGDLGYYCVRAVLTWFGEAPERVFATARYYNGVDFNLSGHCWYSGERTASFDCGFDTVMRQWFEIAGTKASIVCDDFVLPTSDQKARFWIHNADGQSREVAVFDCVQQVEMVRHFADLVRRQAGLDASLGDAVATMRICDALRRSAKEGKPVSV